VNSGYIQKNVLVTGGAGFIGSHLAEKLVSLGARVTILDNLSTGTVENLEQIKNSITFIKDDIQDTAICNRITKNQDIIFHLAALVSVIESQKDPYACFKSNIKGTQNLLEAARKNNINNFVFSSSSAVYGETSSPCKEIDPVKPISVYGYSKYIGETLCNEYYTCFSLNSVILRYFNVYGERQNPYGPYAGVVAKFKKAFQENKPIFVYGDGNQSRDFISVHEVVDANLLFGLHAEKYAGKPYNIGSGKPISILELIQTFKHQYPDSQTSVEFKPARESEISYSCADPSLYHSIRKELEI